MNETVQEIMDEVSAFVRLEMTVVETQGAQINVGETFKVRFTVENTAPTQRILREPQIRFKRPYLQIQRTDFAQPFANGSGFESEGREFPVQVLEPGETASLEFELLATRNLGGLADQLLSEQIAEAWVLAKLDVEEYFHLAKRFVKRTEIVP